jgi:hypothetical protein
MTLDAAPVECLLRPIPNLEASMTRSILALAVVSAFVLTPGSALAQKGQGGPKGPKAKVSQPAPKGGAAGGAKAHVSQGPKVSSTTTTKAHGPKSVTRTQTTKTHGKPAATTVATTKTTKTTNTKGPDRGSSKTTKTATATTTTATGTTLTLSPVQQKLQKNTNLANKLEGRLPLGTNLLAAAEGFRNLGQFVAAVNVSNNLGISFTELKARMVDDGMSLGQAIKAERNDVDDLTTIVRRAERDAQIVIDDADEAARKQDAKAPKAKKRDGR